MIENVIRSYQSLRSLHIIHPFRTQTHPLSFTKTSFFLTSKGFSTTSTNEENGHKNNPNLSLAVIGAGPSGFYTAKYLHSSIQAYNKTVDKDVCDKKKKIGLRIDLIDKLPTPFGLVRSGVAPDHPEVKNVQNDFIALFDKYHRSKSNNFNCDLEYFGNINVGVHQDVSSDVSLSELLHCYDAVVLAYGCQSDRKLGIEGEDLDGVLSARQFVAWYNGHPEYSYLGEHINNLLSNEVSRAVVIGQGNVALDCARVLAKGGTGLYDTDIASHAIPILKDGIKSTTVMGRRGHVQGAFTIKELRELTKLKKEGHNTDFFVRSDELDLGATDATQQELNSPSARAKVRIDKLLREAAATSAKSMKKEEDVSSNNCEKSVELRFLLNPIKFIPKEDDPNRLGSVLCERTKLQGEPHNQIAVGSGVYETIDADMALVSIGYKGLPLPEFVENGFDKNSGTMKNANGKIIQDDENSVGLYVSGWLKRGPSGIIGSNIADAKDTVATIMHDLDQLVSNHKMKNNEHSDGKLKLIDGREQFTKLMQDRNIRFVNWFDYEKINIVEIDKERHRSELQPREKIISVEEMLSIANK